VGLALLGMLVVEGDLVLDFTSHEKMSEQIDAGVELLVANVLPLRFGYSYDLWTERHALSGGLGYVDTSFAVDVGFMRELGADPRMRLAFGFKYFAF